MAQRSGLLRTHRDFRNLWSARFVSSFGDILAQVSLVFYVSDTREEGTAVGALLLAISLPWLLGPIAGSIADRFDRKRLMVTCELLQGAIYTTIALTLPPFPLLLTLVAAAAILSAVYWPTAKSSIPSFVPESDLAAANALVGIGRNLAIALGPIVGGLLVAGVGIQAALGVDAATFFISFVLLLRLPSLPAEKREGEPVSFVTSTLQGAAFAFSHRASRGIVLAVFASMAFISLDNVALPFLTRRELGTGAAGFGLVTTAAGIGMVLAALIMVKWGRSSPRSWFLFGIGSNAVAAFITGFAPTLAVAFIAQSLAGFGNGVENVATDTLIQRSVPHSMLGRTFGAMMTGYVVAEGLAYVAGGLLLDATDARTVFIVSGVGVAVVTVLAHFLLPKDEPAAPERPIGEGTERLHLESSR